MCRINILPRALWTLPAYWIWKIHKETLEAENSASFELIKNGQEELSLMMAIFLKKYSFPPTCKEVNDVESLQLNNDDKTIIPPTAGLVDTMKDMEDNSTSVLNSK